MVLVGVWTFLGFLLRFWQIDHGLPHVFYTDEGHYAYFALNMGGGDLNPHDFYHPNLYYYLCFFGDMAYILAGLVSGLFKAPSDAWRLYVTDPTSFYVIGRAVSASLGTLTIPVVYVIGKKFFDGLTALLASFFWAFAFQAVQWSQVGTTDAPGTFFVMLAFFFALKMFQTGRAREFAAAGFAAGLAGSTRYPGLETFVWGPAAALLLAISKKGELEWKKAGKGVLWFTIFFALGFTTGTPYWILDFPKFKADFLWNWNYYKMFGKGQLGYEGDWNWFYYLANPLVYGLGLPLAILSILGLVFLVIRFDEKHAFFLSFPAVYFLVSGFSRIRVSRYFLPLIPFLCLSAAYLLTQFLSRRGAVKKGTRPWALALAALFVAVPSLASSVRAAMLRTAPDTRTLAAIWIHEHVEPGTKVLETRYAFLPKIFPERKVEALDASLFDSRTQNLSSLRTLDDYREEGFEYLILDEWHQGIVLREGARDPRYRNTVKKYQEFLGELKRSAELAATFSPYREPGVGFDMENVEVASRSLWKMRSLGPTIWIYKL